MTLPSRTFRSARCQRCGYGVFGLATVFGQGEESLTASSCPYCKCDLPVISYEIPGYIVPGRRVDYHSIIGENVTLPGCIIESEVLLLGGTPCVKISGKRGVVAVAALSEAV